MTASKRIAAGEIRADGLGRQFDLTTGGPRSLKETLLHRRRPDTTAFWALRDVDLDVARGQTLAVVGRNGSGKSTLLSLIARIFAPTEGTLQVGGRVGSLLDVGAGFHPEFTGIENVYLSAAVHGLSREFVRQHIDAIIEFAELEEFAHMPVKTYSSGMFLRLGFSVAISVNPDVLLVDEALGVGDEAFQQKCHEKIWEFKRSGGTIVFVSHDPHTVQLLCDQAILLEHGRMLKLGSPEDVLETYHRRLYDGPVQTDALVDQPPTGLVRLLSIRTLGSDGDTLERFLEGGSLTIHASLLAESHVGITSLTFGLRESNGRPIGTQKLADVDLQPGRTESVRLTIEPLPLREGTFMIDVIVHDQAETEIARHEDVLQFSVVGNQELADGPVSLGGTWEVSNRVAG